MPIDHGVFGNRSDFDERIVKSNDELASMVAHWKALGLKIVLTSGSFDMIHIGHNAYLEAASEFGDILIVGVDSDAKIQQRKGPNRPVVPEAERLKALCYQRGVGAVIVKPADEAPWALVKAVHPHVLVATEDAYTLDQIEELERDYCDKVQVLPRMAETSTSARIRTLNLSLGERLGEALKAGFPAFAASVIQNVTSDE